MTTAAGGENHQSKLYLAAHIQKVETGVMGATTAAKTQQARNLLPISKYSLAEDLEKINPYKVN
ncbi:MAG: hypothetical protein IJO42_04340 [Clostridia bacterium]|nr:hypothetical protein [Clostridia bacterium]